MSWSKLSFDGVTSDAERCVMECVFEGAWALAKAARLIQPEPENADNQRARLILIVTQMMSRRECSIGELSDAAFRQFKDSEPSLR